MPSFGERLRHEREARNATIEEIAVATGIEPTYLEALEKDEFHALPGRAFGKLYIRAYAEILGFDPEPLIKDYDREQILRQPPSMEPPDPEPVQPRPVEAAIAQWREAKLAARSRSGRGVASVEAERETPVEARFDEPLEVQEPEPTEAGEELTEIDYPEPTGHEQEPPFVPTPEESARIPGKAAWSNGRVVAVLLSLGLFGGAAAYFGFLRPGLDESEPRSKQETPVYDPPPVHSAAEPPPAGAAEPPAASRPPEPVAGATTAPGHLTVAEFGVGRRVARRRLEGQDDRFADGEVVWFSTRVLGGRRGESIRHIWLHEGRVEESIELGLGGPRWRTHSRMRVRGTGQWAVEARDEEGRVLARATFACVPADP